MADIIFVLSIWFATLLLGVVSLPSAATFFGVLSDRGWSLAKVLGLLVAGYIFFTLATLKVLPLSLIGLLLVLAGWLGFNIFLELKFRPVRRQGFNWRQLISIELFFFGLIGFWAYIRGHQPQLYQIERFMDFGFLQALFNSSTLPLPDIWFSGQPLTYYYFGHFLGYVMLSLSYVPVLPGFFVLVAWLFGLVGINVYRLAKDIAAWLLSSKKSAGHFWHSLAPGLAGGLSFFTVMLAGNWYTVTWAVNQLLGKATKSFWYPDPTRIIPGTITEIPLYAFLVADLHAHVWGLLSGVMVLLLLLVWWRNGRDLVNFKSPYLWLLAFLLALAYLLNSWDVLTLGFLAGIVALANYWRDWQKIFRSALLLIAAAVLAYILALPWTFYSLPGGVKGISIVRELSPLTAWFSVWGTMLIIILILVAVFLKKKFSKKLDQAELPALKFCGLIILTAIVFLAAMEVFYVKDILWSGEWFRANTVFKISFQLWLWLGVLSGAVILWLIAGLAQPLRWALGFFLATMLLFQAVYPLKAVSQATLENKKFTGLGSGLLWWQQKYPYDFEAYQYLVKVREKLPAGQKLKTIVEAEGDSYTDVSRFSVFLGWPTIIGWPVHEWTWRGSYEPIGQRRSQVAWFYTTMPVEQARLFLQKYDIDYIIVGELERQRYPELNEPKLRQLGTAVFDNNKTFIVKVK